MKKRIVVICPGRGSYSAKTLGYLNQHHSYSHPFLQQIDAWRAAQSSVTVSQLDKEKEFHVGMHTRGENASSLIYACAALDFMSLSDEHYEISAICGNSMGWYIALALSGALTPTASFQLIDGMGARMKEKIIGGQVLYPVVDENWVVSKELQDKVAHEVKSVNSQGVGQVYYSILLGGFVVLAGDSGGLREISKRLPPIENFPVKLVHHGAFHTPLLGDISKAALIDYQPALFGTPELPLVDGYGNIWRPYSSNPEYLRHYTLVDQVLDTYNFTKSVEVALKEFNPDHLLLLGPGNSLGAPVGQILVDLAWRGIKSKNDFAKVQQSADPFVLSMGLEEQRSLIRTRQLS